MKKRIVSSLLLATLTMTGCMQNGYTQQSNQGYGQNHSGISRNTPISNGSSTISQAPISQAPVGATRSNRGIKASLAYMYDEERLAQEVYLAIYQRQPVQQLSKIASKAEGRHIDAVKTLAQRYGVATPRQQAGRYQHASIQSLYNKLYAKGIRSQRDALEVGCMVEVVDVEDLNKYMSEAQRANAQDVLQTYDFLRKGSYNHYWAFDKGLKQIGVSNGCCSLGREYCHPEYPQNEKGGHGRGQGQGQGGGWR